MVSGLWQDWGRTSQFCKCAIAALFMYAPAYSSSLAAYIVEVTTVRMLDKLTAHLHRLLHIRQGSRRRTGAQQKDPY
jgi:hypothetical protein